MVHLSGNQKATKLVSDVITAWHPAHVDFLVQKPLIFHVMNMQIKNQNQIQWLTSLNTNKKREEIWNLLVVRNSCNLSPMVIWVCLTNCCSMLFKSQYKDLIVLITYLNFPEERSCMSVVVLSQRYIFIARTFLQKLPNMSEEPWFVPFPNLIKLQKIITEYIHNYKVEYSQLYLCNCQCADDSYILKIFLLEENS